MWDECCWPPPHIARTSLQFCCEPKDTSSRQFGVILLGRGFDISVLEIFWPLCFGFSVFVVSVTWMQRARQCSPIDACMRSQSSAKASTARNGMKLSQLIQQHQVPVDVTHTLTHTHTHTMCWIGRECSSPQQRGALDRRQTCCKARLPCGDLWWLPAGRAMQAAAYASRQVSAMDTASPCFAAVWLGSVAERRAYDLCAYPGLSSGGRLFHRAS